MNRRWLVIPLGVVLLISGTVGGQAALAAGRGSAVGSHRDRLVARWDHDQANGVPASALQPLRAQLAALSSPGWWSPQWWGTSLEDSLNQLDSRTDAAWADAMRSARTAAEQVVADARTLLAQSGVLAPAGFAAEIVGWEHEDGAAGTPADLVRLTDVDSSALTDARTQVETARAQAAERARAAAQAQAVVQAAGGIQVLLSEVAQVDRTATADNLDSSEVDQLAAQLRAALNAGSPGDAVAPQLAAAIASFQQTVAANDRINGAMQPLLWSIDQAVVEQTPSAASFQTQEAALQQSFTAARTGAQIAVVEQQQKGLAAAVGQELQSNGCGHPVSAGKVIVISLSVQQFVAYQDGCAVRSGPVTTGRPALPTPPGDYHVFYKTSPFTMVSPWPRGSVFWYPTTPVRWVLEFREGGYFLHDADWEAPGAYGPGSENNLDAASHGCIHIQTPTMEWLYSWTPVGTEVIVEA